jgi:hypothetical protein
MPMSNEQVTDLLGVVAAGTGRRLGEADLVIWHETLAPLDFKRCVAAVVKIVRNDPDAFIKPGHVWQLAKTTTDGDDARAHEPLMIEGGLIECPKCHTFHRPDEPHEGEEGSPLIRRGDVAKVLPDLFRQMPALTASDVAAHGGHEPVAGTASPPEPTEEERAAEQAERERQLAELQRLLDAETMEEAR